MCGGKIEIDVRNYATYMQRALELAAEGWGRTSPNPMVGAVIVKSGRVVGKGFHAGPGEDHAEAAAIKDAGRRADGASLVVNLEPCVHFGRTPPCVDIIISARIKEVVYGLKDPNPLVNGKGLEKLKTAGIKVQGPVMEKECASLNRIYLHWIKTGTPYVISKVALSLDGKIALENGESKWITGEKCRERMHYWRAGVDAVLVGAGTIRKDDPLLSARVKSAARQPRPVILTKSGDVGVDKRVMERNPIIISGERDWNSILAELAGKGITSVMVEGGGNVHSQIIRERLPQYIVASLSTKLIGRNGREWLPEWNSASVDKTPRIKPDQILVVDDNIIIEGEIDYGDRG